MLKSLFYFILIFSLGAGSILLMQWMRPPTKDPYFFLTPKPNYLNDHYQPIEMPIALGKKGSAIDFVFWSVPQPDPKLLYLFPVSSPSPEIMLKIHAPHGEPQNYSLMRFFEGAGPLPKAGMEPILNIKAYKINPDLSETLVLDRDCSYNYIIKRAGNYDYKASWERTFAGDNRDTVLFRIVQFGSYDYGQYRLHITVLTDWPQLNTPDLDYFIHIRQKTYK